MRRGEDVRCIPLFWSRRERRRAPGPDPLRLRAGKPRGGVVVVASQPQDRARGSLILKRLRRRLLAFAGARDGFVTDVRLQPPTPAVPAAPAGRPAVAARLHLHYRAA